MTIKTLTSVVLLSTLAAAQGIRRQADVIVSGGFPNATVRVCTEPATGVPCSPIANIFSDPGLTQAISNPLTTDANGNYAYFGAIGQTYHEQITGNGLQEYDVPYITLPLSSSALLAASNTWTGVNTFDNAVLVNNSSVFPGTQMNEFLASSLNNCSTLNVLTGNILPPAYYETDAVSGCVVTPSGAATQGNAVAAYAQANTAGSGSRSSNAGNTVAVFSICRANGNDLASDFPNLGLTGLRLTGREIDMGVSQGNSAAYVHGLDIFYSPYGTGGSVPSDSAYIQLLNTSGTYSTGAPAWGIHIDPLTVTGPAIEIDQDAATSGTSQPFQMCGTNSSSLQRCTALFSDPNGNPIANANGSNAHFLALVERGTCSMSGTSSCTFSTSQAFSVTPICVAGVSGSPGATAYMASCSVSGTTATVTSNASNSLTWAAVFVGNPN